MSDAFCKELYDTSVVPFVLIVLVMGYLQEKKTYRWQKFWEGREFKSFDGFILIGFFVCMAFVLQQAVTVTDVCTAAMAMMVFRIAVLVVAIAVGQGVVTAYRMYNDIPIPSEKPEPVVSQAPAEPEPSKEKSVEERIEDLLKK